ncbi:ATP-dependent Clp protease proteolytic subunit [Poriferisphaera corsica]|uniref:ATP-dependent Clp protease proteolytic subunit n=1 Tax=Poriferisphaera corsica TaxID=2528020 RepID=UPI00190AB3E8|nr:ATP-dependent Clp protease proteolytic subunit [Poriferisphaera corsica]
MFTSALSGFIRVIVVIVGLLLALGCETTSRAVNYSNIDQMIEAGYPNVDVDLNSPLLKNRKIILTTDLNATSARDVITKLIYLDQLDSSKPIDFFINTNGGDLDVALAIIQTYRQIKAPVNTHALVDVKSGGVLLVAAGTGRRIAYPSSLFTVHGGVASSGTPLQYKQKALAIYEREMLTTMNLPREWFPLQGQVFHTMTASEALEYMVVDLIAAPERPLRSQLTEGS